MTNEQAKQIAPVLQAWADGKVIQWKWKAEEGWFDATADSGLSIDDESVFSQDFRIKPEKKLRAWKPDEVPVGSVIRIRNATHSDLFQIVGRSSNEGRAVVYFGSWCLAGYPDSKTLALNYEYSIDGKSPWLPCGIEE